MNDATEIGMTWSALDLGRLGPSCGFAGGVGIRLVGLAWTKGFSYWGRLDGNKVLVSFTEALKRVCA